MARVGDIEAEVYKRLTLVCHLWPGITPWNVWDLQLREWLLFAASADDYAEKMKEGSRG